MRQYAGFGSARESNRRYRYLLEQGQTGLSVAFDLPTQMGYDSDDPAARGEVGKVGVAIASIDDMRDPDRGPAARPGLDLDDDQLHGLDPARALLSRWRASAGVSLGRRSRAPSRTTCSRSTSPGAPTSSRRGASLKITTDIFAFCGAEVPRWNTISISGYHIREAGSTAVQEVAFTLSNAIAYVEAALARGPRDRRLRAAALVLLQRPRQLLRGGRQVPRGALALGRDRAGPLRREGPALLAPALPHADGRLDADGAAARRQRRARRSAGPLGGAGRHAVAPHQRHRTRRWRCRPRRRRGWRCARSRSSPTKAASPTSPIRSAARTWSRPGPRRSASGRAR